MVCLRQQIVCTCTRLWIHERHPNRRKFAGVSLRAKTICVCLREREREEREKERVKMSKYTHTHNTTHTQTHTLCVCILCFSLCV